METKTEKTIREWLNDLPEDIRERAVRNYDPAYADTDPTFKTTKERSVEWAVCYAFDWDTTPEPFPYWARVSDRDYVGARAILKQSPPSPDLREQLDEANKKIDEAVRLLRKCDDPIASAINHTPYRTDEFLFGQLRDEVREFLSKHS